MSKLLKNPHEDARFPARRKLIRFLVMVSICLAALGLVVVEIENWRGRNAWEKFQREAEAKGETFDILKLAPPKVPNERNFAGVPMFAKLFEMYRDSAGKPHLRETDDLSENILNINGVTTNSSPSLGNWMTGRKIDLREWQTYYRKVMMETNDWRSQSRYEDRYGKTDRTGKWTDHIFPVPSNPGKPADDVLIALSKFEAPLAQLRIASDRPFARFPINYEDNALAFYPHLKILRPVSDFLTLRALANLEKGKREESAADVVLNLRVANAVRGEPSLISQYTRVAMVPVALQALWEGLDEHVWSDAQLAAFQKELTQFDFLESYQLAMRGERAWTKLLMEMVRTNRSELGYSGPCESEDDGGFHLRNAHFYLMPDGWFYQNQLRISRLYEIALTIVDPASRRINKNKLMQLSNSQSESQQGFVPYNMLVGFLFSGGYKPALKFAFAQTAVDQAMLACALERSRLVHGTFPETLAELSPKFIEKVPHDIMNGKPLRYSRTTDGKFTLYSVGWNETDEGGIVAGNSLGQSRRMEEGDWVWRSSTNSDARSPLGFP